jgi:hypothetical protein
VYVNTEHSPREQWKKLHRRWQNFSLGVEHIPYTFAREIGIVNQGGEVCLPLADLPEDNLKIFFDVDNTILCTTDLTQSLRPGVVEALQRIKNDGHRVYIWSAGGKSYCERIVKEYGLSPWVDGCFDKDVDCPVSPDCVIDDDPHLVEKYKGWLVSPYREINSEDRELWRVYSDMVSREGYFPRFSKNGQTSA